MDDRERMLATAWRDLAGWHVGMALKPWCWKSVGGVVVRIEQDGMLWVDDGSEHYAWSGQSKDGLPDPDAPANWGVWLAWAQREAGQRPKWLDYGDALPYELLQWYVEVCDRHKQQGVTPTTAMPPSVIAWWESEELSDWP